MRIYEVVYIFSPTLDETALGPKLEKYHGILTGTDGAEVLEVDHWGVPAARLSHRRSAARLLRRVAHSVVP